MSVLSNALSKLYEKKYLGGSGTKKGASKNKYIQCLKANKGKKGAKAKCISQSKRKPNSYIECLKENKGKKGSLAKCLAQSKKRMGKMPTVEEIKQVEKVVDKVSEKVAEKLTENIPVTQKQEEKVQEAIKEVINKSIAEEPLKKVEENLIKAAVSEVPEVKDVVAMGNGLIGGCYDSDSDNESIHIHLGGKKMKKGGAGIWGNGYKRNGRKIRKDKGKSKSSPWIKHVKEMSKKLKIPYNEALKDPRVKKSYRS